MWATTCNHVRKIIYNAISWNTPKRSWVLAAMFSYKLKESVSIKIEFNFQRISLVHQYGRLFIVLTNKYGVHFEKVYSSTATLGVVWYVHSNCDVLISTACNKQKEWSECKQKGVNSWAKRSFSAVQIQPNLFSQNIHKVLSSFFDLIKWRVFSIKNLIDILRVYFIHLIIKNRQWNNEWNVFIIQD